MIVASMLQIVDNLIYVLSMGLIKTAFALNWVVLFLSLNLFKVCIPKIVIL